MTAKAEHAPRVPPDTRKSARGVAITCNITESKHCAWCNAATPYLFSFDTDFVFRYRKCALCLDWKEKMAVETLYGVMGSVR